MSEVKPPLTGLRVVEFTHAALGPSCGLFLADMGAEVIRVEPPTGDPTRRLKGFGAGYFPFLNRNKRSLAVDLKQPRGKAVVWQLLQGSDALVENFAPGTMGRLGLGHEALAADCPRLIYCSLKGFLPGPYQHRTALDEVVQMMSGLAYMTGPPGQPLRAGASVIDIMTGMMGAIGILAALREREQTGRGGLVRSGLFETAAFLMGHHMATAAVTGEPLQPMPARVSAWAIYNQFETTDGQRVFVGVTSDRQWARFCQVFERPDWLADQRLTTNNDRIDANDWLLPAVREMLGALPLADVMRRCEDAGLPFSPVAHAEDLFDDPQLLGSQSLIPTVLPDGRTTALPGLPFRLDGARWVEQAQLASVGENSNAILRELGCEQAEIAELRAAGVVS